MYLTDQRSYPLSPEGVKKLRVSRWLLVAAIVIDGAALLAELFESHPFTVRLSVPTMGVILFSLLLREVLKSLNRHDAALRRQ
ncbi:hypothetical protein DQ392_14460 [Streptomyces reniochalinae]|uniref:Uncharacterized protein n=1 Tax=Streptomyces reniochalinae TaxID=2250578 RepID=A0A367EKD6_9ACTN|nr:hypothetical protein DQ392_14460 [Streptomyces reniochalinae]